MLTAIQSIFLIAKILNLINWSWWLVFFPVWIYIILNIIIEILKAYAD